VTDPEFRVCQGLTWWLAVRSWLACPELLAQDLLDAGDCFVHRLLMRAIASSTACSAGVRLDSFLVTWASARIFPRMMA
jgi:hypothetical protein